MSCFYVARDEPRMVRNRHQDGCAARTAANGGETYGSYTDVIPGPETASSVVACAGCLPCPEPHCVRCGREHVEQLVCPGCIADARADLAAITTLCANLPAEARAKGVDSEAMNLLGPVADPEALGHVQASIHAGRLDAGWLSVADGEHHPLTFAWWWNECWREAFDHTETPAVAAGFGVVQLVAYLDANLAYAAQQDELPFGQFATQAADCRRHLERVLHDGSPSEYAQEVNCLVCGSVPQRRTLDDGLEDDWWCARCRRSLSPHEFYLAAAEGARMTARAILAEVVESQE